MTVEAAALARVHRHARSVGQAPVFASRAVGRHAFLRAVVHGVGIDRLRGVARQRGVERAAADGLVVVAAGCSASLARDPGLAVVVRVGRQAAAFSRNRHDARRGDQLRDDGPPGPLIREEDRVEARRGCRGALVRPRGDGRRVAVVEVHAQRLGDRLDEDAAGLPAHADRRLSGGGAQRSGRRVVGEGDRLAPLPGGIENVLSQRHARRVAVPVGARQGGVGRRRDRVGARRRVDEERDLELPRPVARSTGRTVAGVVDLEVPVALRGEVDFDEVRPVGGGGRDDRELEVVTARVVVAPARPRRGGQEGTGPRHRGAGLRDRPGGRGRRLKRGGAEKEEEEDRSDSRGRKRDQETAQGFHRFNSFRVHPSP